MVSAVCSGAAQGHEGAISMYAALCMRRSMRHVGEAQVIARQRRCEVARRS